MAIVRVVEAFADFSTDPNGRVFQQGLLVDDSDPAVRKNPQRFEPVEAAAVRATETAVSAPGLRRSITRPEKPARHHGRGNGGEQGAEGKPAKPAKKAAAKKAPAKKAAPAPAPTTNGTEKL